MSVGRKPVVPIAAMRAADLDDRIDARIIVEQHAAAAVDLRVDESGHEPLAFEIVDALLAVARAAACALGLPLLMAVHGLDTPGVEHDDAAFFEARIGQHAAVDQRQAHHSVSVTLLRCGGLSGLKPRAKASAVAMR